MPAVTFNVSAIRPTGTAPLSPGASELLFRPVFKFTSDLNRTKSGDWPEQAPSPLHHWIVIESAEDTKPPLIAPEEPLPEGYYNIKAILIANCLPAPPPHPHARPSTLFTTGVSLRSSCVARMCSDGGGHC